MSTGEPRFQPGAPSGAAAQADAAAPPAHAYVYVSPWRRRAADLYGGSDTLMGPPHISPRRTRGIMCFSAAASFGLSGILAGVGTASIARSPSRAMRVLASAPLIFAVQQAAEGTVWLTLGPTTHGTLHRLSVALFLGIALVVWPLWAPNSLRLIERSDMRRRVLTGFCGLGFAVSAVAATLLARWPPIASVAGHSVSYQYAATGLPLPQFVFLLAYAIPAVGSFFVSTTRMAPTIGGTLVVSLIVATLIQREALASVWCFFAAVVSVLILVAVSRRVS